MRQIRCQLRNWWTMQKISSPKQIGRSKVSIFSYILFRGYTCNFFSRMRTKKLRRDTQGSLHSSTWFCRAQIEIVLIHTYTMWQDWRNICGTMHLDYADSLWMIWKFPRRKMEWVFKPYFHIMTQSCILVKTTKQLCPLDVQFHLLLLESNLKEE